jgi:glycosyltransferase involved in cell wall biosynthesis
MAFHDGSAPTPDDRRPARHAMRVERRLSICYAAPGQNLLPSAGPTRNVLSVAEALSQWANVTVAFRNVLEPINQSTYQVIAIEPGSATSSSYRDDTATRGVHPLRHLSYCRKLQAFARQRASSFDVVLEKGWRLSGFLSACFRRAGVPTALVENTVSLWTEPLTNVREISKYVLHRAAVAVTNSCCHRIPIVIAETEELKEKLVTHRGLSPDQIRVIGLGVDHRLFRPMDQQRAREALGITRDALVVLYVGGIDEFHDLEPVIQALGVVNNPAMQLHVVGNGEYRARSEALAESAAICSRFHGHVPHDRVPHYIAAADLCIAPYRTSAFHDGLVTFATLKIPEYMACGRTVVSVPSPAINRLIANSVNGFLFPNDTPSWVSFLSEPPSQVHLTAMGRAAAEAVTSISWETTARRYLEVCEQLVSLRRDSGSDVLPG